MAEPNGPAVALRGVSLRYGDAAAFSGLCLTLLPGERAAVMGPSGCGKTSLLRLIAGLEQPEAGTVSVGAARLAVMFQEPRLLPWRSAAENVNLVLSDRPVTLPAARAWLERLGLDREAADKYPAELSGGMQQRVALARTLALGGDLLLLDEPFKALDEVLRLRVIDAVSEAAGDAAILLVTHDRAEAERLGCRIIEFDTLTK